MNDTLNVQVLDGRNGVTVMVNNHVLCGAVPEESSMTVFGQVIGKSRLLTCMSPSLDKGLDGAILPLELFAGWLANGDVGLSSLAIAQRFTGVRMTANGTRKNGCADVPHDASDFQRCLRMFDMVPVARQYVHLMRDVSPAWERISDRWEKLEDLYREEAPTGQAPKTSEMLKTLREGTGNV